MGIFSSSLQHPDRLWGSLDVLSSGYQGGLYLGLNLPRREADHSPPSSAEVKEWVELCHHSPSMSSRRCLYLYLAKLCRKRARGEMYRI